MSGSTDCSTVSNEVRIWLLIRRRGFKFLLLNVQSLQQTYDSSIRIQFFIACPYAPLSYSAILASSFSSFPATFFLSSSSFPPSFLRLFSFFHAPSHTCSHITSILLRASLFFPVFLLKCFSHNSAFEAIAGVDVQYLVIVSMVALWLRYMRYFRCCPYTRLEVNTCGLI